MTEELHELEELEKELDDSSSSIEENNEEYDIGDIEIPVYDGRESILNYTRRLKQFRSKLNEKKYELLINFINDWLNYKKGTGLNYLAEFKNFSEKKLLSDKKHNDKILKKYCPKIKKAFDIKLSFEINDEKYDEKYIFYVLTRALSVINFRLVHKIIYDKKTGKDTLYTIKKKY